MLRTIFGFDLVLSVNAFLRLESVDVRDDLLTSEGERALAVEERAVAVHEGGGGDEVEARAPAEAQQRRAPKRKADLKTAFCILLRGS